MTIYINTKDPKLVEVSLKKGNKTIKSLNKERQYGSQVLLPMIEEVLRGLNYKDLEAIEVDTGPGSFTGLRVGVSVANALGYTLGIPVNGKAQETDLHY